MLANMPLPRRRAGETLQAWTIRAAHHLEPRIPATHRFSHLTAAAIQGMRTPSTPALHQWVHVTGFEAERGLRRHGVDGHKSRRPVETVDVDGLRCSNPIAAWAECSELLPIDDLVIMGDGLLARGGAIATLDDLERIARSRAGARGAKALRAAMRLVRAGTDSARETSLRLLLVRAGLPEPEINAPLFDDRGRLIGHGDLAWPAERIVVEYEGRQHAEDPRQFTIDIGRIDRILEAGYRHIRVDDHRLRERDGVVSTVRRAFASAHAREGTRSRQRRAH